MFCHQLINDQSNYSQSLYHWSMILYDITMTSCIDHYILPMGWCHYIQIAVQEGEIQRLLAKLDYVITTPPSSDGKGSAESAVVRCEKVWLMHC